MGICSEHHEDSNHLSQNDASIEENSKRDGRTGKVSAVVT